MKLTPRQKEIMHQIEYCGGRVMLDGAREHSTARSLEKKGLIRVDPWSWATFTEAGRQALKGGE